MRALGLMLVAATLLGGRSEELGASQEPRPTFAVSVEGVQVDVLVTERGRPVSGLTAGEFELRDNGVVQRIEGVVREDVPLDVFLVLDTSASVVGEPLEALGTAARMVVDALAPRDRVALLTFGHGLTGSGRLSSDTAAVRSAIDRIRASGATSLVDAVYAALALRDASRTRALVIVFTDGQDTSSWLLPATVFDVARRTDAVVYGVALAPTAPERPDVVVPPLGRSFPMVASPVTAPPADRYQAPAFLEEISSVTGGRLLRTGNPNRLREAFVQALQEMKTRYVLSFTPQGVTREGWHALDVTLVRRKAEVTARRGYFVPPRAYP